MNKENNQKGIGQKVLSNMYRVNEWLRDTPALTFVLIFWGAGVAFNILFNVAIKLLGVDVSAAAGEAAPKGVVDYITLLIFAPPIETALCQALPYYLLNKIPFFRKRVWLIILVSALVFASGHIYAPIYILFALFPGVLLMWGYHLRQGQRAFWTITAIHALVNATGVVLDHLEDVICQF